MKHCLVFASLISPSKMILFEKKYQTFDTVFHHQMKHLEVRQKYSAARRIFNSLLGVSSGDETLHLMFDILLNQPCKPPAKPLAQLLSQRWHFSETDLNIDRTALRSDKNLTVFTFFHFFLSFSRNVFGNTMKA